MGTALVKIKIMPDNPKANLKEIEEKAKKITEKSHGKNPRTEIEPVAFGLNAIILSFSLDESKSIDDIENPLKDIEHVSSAELIDFRRAFG